MEQVKTISDESESSLLGAEDAVDRWLEVFSIFVHDLESPIASVKYLLRLIDSGRFDPENKRHQRLVHSSGIAIDRAESILYDLLAVAKAGKAGIPVNMTSLVPDAVIMEAVDLAVGAAIENGIEVTYTDNAEGIAVLADPKLLKRTLDNLLYNAIRHTPSGAGPAPPRSRRPCPPACFESPGTCRSDG